MPFNSQQQQELRSFFDEVDTNRNGSIDANELRALLSKVGEKDVPAFRLRDLIAEVDHDKNGTIEFNEFLSVFEKIRLDSSSSDGSGFASIVKKAGGLNVMGGTSSASSSSTVHSFSDEEKIAFLDWINYVLAQDADLKSILPIAEDGDALFRSVRTGVMMCKLINDAVPDTIDERAINKKGTHPVQLAENQTLMLNSARAIGANVVNIGPQDMLDGVPHLVLGLLWQIIKIGLFAKINLQNCPGLARLCQGDETLEDLMALPIETILLRWVNFHLAAAGHPRRINNFSGDIKDSEAYTILIKQIAPKSAGVDTNALQESDSTRRAEHVLRNADKIDCKKFVRAKDIVRGNPKLNLAFVANMFNKCPALEPIEEVVVIEETREEKTYRNWMNSLGVNPFVNNLYQDLRDGLVLLQLFDKVQPGIVDWKKVNQPPWKAMGANMKKLENCNYAVDIAKKMNFSVVGIQGKDIFDGTKTLTLAIVWQLMRAHTLSILNALAGGSRRISDNEIIEWVNATLTSARKSDSSCIQSFKDPQIATAVPVIDLIDAIRPGSIDYSLVFSRPSSDDERLKNAKYAISMGRKVGATIFALAEDLVELKHKMIMTVYACLMAASYSK